MRKLAYTIIAVLVSSFTICHYLHASPDKIPATISGSSVKIEIFEDGKITGDKLLADYLFVQDKNSQWHGYWRHIYIHPDDDQKDVLIKIESWSIENAQITNFQTFKNGCSFDLDVGNLYGNRKIQIVIKKEGIKDIVLGSALWYSEILERELKKEWKSTDKLYFELPYTKIF